MERPFGVTLIFSFFLLQSIINMVTAYSYYVSGAPILPLAYYSSTSGIGFAIAYGLWIGNKWGRIGAILLSGLQILIGFLGVVVSIDIEVTSPIQGLTKVIVYAIVLHFVTRPEISDYFKK